METSILIPYGENGIYSLYDVFFSYSDYKTWSIISCKNMSQPIKDKLRNIQEYFKSYKKDMQYAYQLISNSHPSKHLDTFTDTTPSIFLGLFMTAYQKIENREFKSDWQSITLTGDVDWDGKTLRVIGIRDIDKKFKAVQKYAKQYPKKKHLFLYVGGEKCVDAGEYDNVVVKHIYPDSPNNLHHEGQIYNIIDFVFNSALEIKYIYTRKGIDGLIYREAYDFSKIFFERKEVRNNNPTYNFPAYEVTEKWYKDSYLYVLKDKNNNYWGHFCLVPLKENAVHLAIQGNLEEEEITEEHIDSSKTASNFYIGDLILIPPRDLSKSPKKPYLNDYAVKLLIISTFKNVLEEKQLKDNICVIAFAETRMGQNKLKEYHFLNNGIKKVFYKTYSKDGIIREIRELEREVSQIKGTVEAYLTPYYT